MFGDDSSKIVDFLLLVNFFRQSSFYESFSRIQLHSKENFKSKWRLSVGVCCNGRIFKFVLICKKEALPPFLDNFFSTHFIIILTNCTRAIMKEPKATDPRWYRIKRQKLEAIGNFNSDLSL